MKRPSSIDRLPPEIRDLIARLRERGWSIREIVQKLSELDLDIDQTPSRSALQRYLQRGQRLAENVQRAKIVSEALVGKLDDAADSRLARGNIELMHSIVMSVQAAALEAADGEGGEIKLTPQEVMYLAKSIDHLGKAARDDVERTMRIEERIVKRERARAIKAATSVSKRMGLPLDFIDQFRNALEIAKPAPPPQQDGDA